MRPSLFILLVLFNTVQPGHAQTLRKSICNVTYDRVLLKNVTLLSKYIFIGKVYAVKSKDNVKIYKVDIRRVLKGDLIDLSVNIRFGSAKSIRFSDATVLVQNTLGSKCSVLRGRNYAIFLTEKLEEGVLGLSFVVEPVPLTLRNIGIIEAAIKALVHYMSSIMTVGVVSVCAAQFHVTVFMGLVHSLIMMWHFRARIFATEVTRGNYNRDIY